MKIFKKDFTQKTIDILRKRAGKMSTICKRLKSIPHSNPEKSMNIKLIFAVIALKSSLAYVTDSDETTSNNGVQKRQQDVIISITNPSEVGPIVTIPPK